MRKNIYRVEARVAWWFEWLYVPGVLLMSGITGRMPDMGKVEYYASRAVTIKLRRVRGQIDA